MTSEDIDIAFAEWEASGFCDLDAEGKAVIQSRALREILSDVYLKRLGVYAGIGYAFQLGIYIGRHIEKRRNEIAALEAIGVKPE